MPAYRLPLDPNQLMQAGRRAAQVDLQRSVREHILLLLISSWGSLRADPGFGCAFWEYDFESGTRLESRRHQLERSVCRLITDREPRLDPNDLKVSLRIHSTPLPSYRGRTMLDLKKRVEMKVTGRLLQTNQVFSPPPFQLYFSPVAIADTNRPS